MSSASVPGNHGEAIDRMAGQVRAYATGLHSEAGRLRQDLFVMLWKRDQGKEVLQSMAENLRDLDIRIGQVRLVLAKMEGR